MSQYGVRQTGRCVSCGWPSDHPYHFLHIPGSRKPKVPHKDRVVIGGLVYDRDKVPMQPEVFEIDGKELRVAPERHTSVWSVGEPPYGPSMTIELANAPEPTPQAACVHCGYEAKSPAGLAAHKRFKHKTEVTA